MLFLDPKPMHEPDTQMVQEARLRALERLRRFSKRAARRRARRLVAAGIGAFFFALFVAFLWLGLTSQGDAVAAGRAVDSAVQVMADITRAGAIALPGFVAALLTLAVVNGGNLASSFVITMAIWIGSASVTWASISIAGFWLAVWDEKTGPDASIIYATLALAGVCVALATAIAEVLPANDEWRRERMHERLKRNTKISGTFAPLLTRSVSSIRVVGPGSRSGRESSQLSGSWRL
ncbi:hypothetical protein GCM10023087_36150 [Microbacterium rhizosphaerae]